MSDNNLSKSAIFAPQVKLTKPANSRNLRASLLIGIVALVTGATLLLWVLFFQSDNNIAIDLNSVATTQDGRLELHGLTYRGKTAGGDPFAFHAQKASEDANDTNLVDLTKLDGTIDSEKNGQITLTSLAGKFNQATNFVTLIGDVIITQATTQTIFETQFLTGDLDKGHFNAPQAVALQSPTAHIIGESMMVTDFGDKIIFKGQSNAVIGEEETNEK